MAPKWRSPNQSSDPNPKDKAEDTDDQDDQPDTEDEDTTDGDEDSEDGDDEQEDSEDTDEEGDDEDEEDSDSDDDDSDDDEPQFVDPSKLPKEILPHYKRMQAAFTRKMQEASVLKQKAEAFDRLSASPAFRAWLSDSKNGDGDNGNRSKKTDSKKSKDSSSREGFLSSMREMVEEAIDKRLGPHLENEKKKDLTAKANEEISFMDKKYDGWRKYLPEIRAWYADNPGSSNSLLSVFKEIAFDDAATFGRRKFVKDVKKRRHARGHRPTDSRQMDEKPEKGHAKSISAAWDMAEKAAQKLGFNKNKKNRG